MKIIFAGIAIIGAMFSSTAFAGCGRATSTSFPVASIAASGGPNLALEAFLTFYIACVVITWWYYLRRSFLVQRVRSLAEARV